MLTYVITKILMFLCLITMPIKTNADLSSRIKHLFHDSEYPPTMEQALGKLTSEIVNNYFVNSHCLVVVSERNYSNVNEIFQYLPVTLIPFIHIQFVRNVGLGSLREYDERNSNVKVFENILMTALDQRCDGYVFQVSDLSYMIQRLNKANKFCNQRNSRRYIVLPTISGVNNPSFKAWDKEISEVFRTRTMRNYPDLIVLTVMNMTEEIENFVDKIDFEKTHDKYEDDDSNVQYLLNTSDSRIEEISGNVTDNKCIYHNDEESLRKESKATYICTSNTVTVLNLNNKKIELFNKKNMTNFSSKSKRQEHEFVAKTFRYPFLRNNNKNTNKLYSFAFKIVTHRYAYPDPSESVILDVWESVSGFHSNANLYPNKLVNLMGKPFYVTTFTYLPSAYLKVENNTVVLDGYEHRMLEEFTKKLNMTIEAVYDTDGDWGTVFENGSAVGILRFVLEEDVDLAHAAFNYWLEEYKFMDYSVPVGWSKITALVPKPTRLPRITDQLLPFSHDVWSAVLIYFSLSVVFLFTLSKISQKILGGDIKNRYESLFECFFRTMGFFVRQVPDEERNKKLPRREPVRHLINWTFLQLLFLTTAYSAGLASVFTTPRFTAPIETIEDLADSGIRWAGSEEVWVKFIEDSSYSGDSAMNKLFYLGTTEELGESLTKREMGYGVEILEGGTITLQSFITEDSLDNLRLMEEYIYDGHLAYILRKGSPFMEKLNMFMYKAKEAGLTLHWEKAVALEYMDQGLQRAAEHSRERVLFSPNKLQLEDVGMAYIILAVGLILSIAAFISEHVYLWLMSTSRIQEDDEY